MRFWCRCIGLLCIAGGFALLAKVIIILDQSAESTIYTRANENYQVLSPIVYTTSESSPTQDLVSTTIAEACLACHATAPSSTTIRTVASFPDNRLQQFEDRFTAVGRQLLSGFVHHTAYSAPVHEYWQIHQQYEKSLVRVSNLAEIMLALDRVEQQIVRLTHELQFGKIVATPEANTRLQDAILRISSKIFPIVRPSHSSPLPPSEYHWSLILFDVPAPHHCSLTPNLRGPPALNQMLVIDLYWANGRKLSAAADMLAPFCFRLCRNLSLTLY